MLAATGLRGNPGKKLRDWSAPDPRFGSVVLEQAVERRRQQCMAILGRWEHNPLSILVGKRIPKSCMGPAEQLGVRASETW
jgi:hypothetical protein